MDDCWMDNVGQLITALEKLGIDPVEWAREPDHGVFTAPPGFPDVPPDEMNAYQQLLCDINFASGYLQATSNLTNMSWAEQMAEGLRQEERANAT